MSETGTMGLSSEGEPQGAAPDDLVGTGTPAEPAWLLLVYRIPSEPTRLRATVWRRLKALGANWYAKVHGRDVYRAPTAAATAAALVKCEEALELYAARVYVEEDEGG
jgi:hypothetical protein